jgi:threonine dehydrogenase-like Zn-dependent dehydrogenase
VFGLGPIGQMSARIALRRGASAVFGVDLVTNRLAVAASHGVQPVDVSNDGNGTEQLRELTGGRGPDAVIDAVGMEAHGSRLGKLAHQLAGLMPEYVTQQIMDKAGIDRLRVLHAAIDAVRRGGTISLSGVYGGSADPLPVMDVFDKQIQLRMGQANVKCWIPSIMPLLQDESDPLDVEGLATHHLPLDQAPRAYEMFQKKEDGVVKVVFNPQAV